MERPVPETVYRGDIAKLLEKVDRERGLDLAQYRRAYVERRIASRLRALGMHTYRQYSRYIEDHPEEYARMLDALTINVTEFFRDPPVYRLFRDEVVPSIVDAKRKGRQRIIRVWSAGCATGEEAYTLAMCFHSALGADAPGFMLTVTGTDIDPGALAVAAANRYDVAKLSHIPREDQARYVTVSGDTFSFKPEITRLVRFRPLNLFQDPPIKVVDLIFCRNVFTYFTREQQARVLDSFCSALARGGHLVLGRSEKMAPGVVGCFDTVSGRERIYRKR
ncbi:MAG: protein-glutamate O-methyltransferase CheR [Coriobacteriia bacterium]|nr:protein-glutamate O-methyltransferase CheR [Coriobacteriia bacterium]